MIIEWLGNFLIELIINVIIEEGIGGIKNIFVVLRKKLKWTNRNALD